MPVEHVDRFLRKDRTLVPGQKILVFLFDVTVPFSFGLALVYRAPLSFRESQLVPQTAEASVHIVVERDRRALRIPEKRAEAISEKRALFEELVLSRGW